MDKIRGARQTSECGKFEQCNAKVKRFRKMMDISTRCETRIIRRHACDVSSQNGRTSVGLYQSVTHVAISPGAADSPATRRKITSRSLPPAR